MPLGGIRKDVMIFFARNNQPSPRVYQLTPKYPVVSPLSNPFVFLRVVSSFPIGGDVSGESSI
jgi:hypothetical protein